MKQKKETFFSNKLKGLIAFRNDIDGAINILVENGLSISIQDDKHTYENIDEVINNVGSVPKNLKIEGRNKETYESLELSFDKNELRISGHGSEQMYSLGFRMMNYFSKIIPWHYKVFNPWIFYFTTFTPLFFLSYAFDKTGELIRPWILILFSLSLLLGLFSYCLRRYNYGIRLIKNHEHGFWNRNKDSLIVSIISTTVGAVLGIIGTLLAQYISK